MKNNLSKKILSVFMIACLSFPVCSTMVSARTATWDCIKSSKYPESKTLNNVNDISLSSSTKNASSNILRSTVANKYHDKEIYVRLDKIIENYETVGSVRVSTCVKDTYHGADEGGYADGYNKHYRYISDTGEYMLLNDVMEAARREHYTSNAYGSSDLLYKGYEGDKRNQVYWYSKAMLEFKFGSSNKGNEISGVWSPDSVYYRGIKVTWGDSWE